MSFSKARIAQAIEHGLDRTSVLPAPKVLEITSEDVDWHGLSANRFARCRALVLAGNQEQQVELVIKRWAPGGTTDIVMGLSSLPRESLAFSAGILTPDALPPGLDAPFVAALDDPASNAHWVVLRDVSAELAAFIQATELSEIERRYAVVLDRLALMHATWEKPGRQARLKKLSWLVPDGVRLARGEAVTRFVEGLPLRTSVQTKLERAQEGIRGANIGPARQAFYKTLSHAEGELWRRHECDRSALIAAMAEFPTTLVHGDCYPPNIGLRVVDGEETLVLIDWEWLGNGCGSLDVAKLLTEGAALTHEALDVPGLTAHYFKRYLAHGGTLFNEVTWKSAYELAEVYQALSAHILAVGWSKMGGSAAKSCRESRTPRLTELIARYLG